MEEQYTSENMLWIRFIGVQADITKFIMELEKVYGIRLFPDAPKPERGRTGKVRIYLDLPLERKEILTDE